MALVGIISPPKQEKRSLTWMRNALLFTLAKRIEIDRGLRLTRGDAAKKHESACDAVAEGLRRNGHHLEFRAIKELCVGTGKQMQQFRESLKDWLEADQYARQAGVIPAKYLDAVWNHVGENETPPT